MRAGFQVEAHRVARRRELRERRAHDQLQGQHAEHRRPGPPAIPRREVPERPRSRREPERQHDEAQGVGEREQRDPEPQEGAGAEPARGPPRLERLVAQPLDADGAEDRHGDHREVAHASGVVQVDVAEGHPQHEVAHPGGRDDGVEHQDPGEHQRSAERPDEHATPARAQGERHAEQDRRAGVGARRGAERQRPRRPHPVGLQGAGVAAAEGADRVAEPVVAGREARRLEGIHARQQDREGEHRQGDEEHRRAGRGRPGRPRAASGRCLRRDARSVACRAPRRRPRRPGRP